MFYVLLCNADATKDKDQLFRKGSGKGRQFCPLYSRRRLWQHGRMSFFLPFFPKGNDAPLAAAPRVRLEGGQPGADGALRETVVFSLADGTPLRAVVRRSARARRFILRLNEGGGLYLVVPAALSLAGQEERLTCLLPGLERAWQAHCARRGEADAEARKLPERLSLPVMGREWAVGHGGDWRQGCAAGARSPHPPVRVQDGARRVLLVETESALTLYGQTDAEPAAVALRLWCRRQAEGALPELVRHEARRHGFAVARVSVRDQRSRWGSCTRDRQGAGRISLNWRAVLLPEEDAVFLCLHELCHIRQMNHSPAFRQELARYAADWPLRERRLHDFWRALPWWARPVTG